MTLLAPRPFSTLGLAPFLFAEARDLQLIQSEYFKLSRKFHPDLASALTEDAQKAQEAASAKLNLDYSLVKDFWKLLESVIHGAKIPDASGGKLPPALAAEYFELQDEWTEKSPQDPSVLTSQRNFLKQVNDQLHTIEREVIEFAKRFPYRGFANLTAPWNEHDLKELSELMQKLRYLKGFAHDIESKIPREELL